MNEEYITKYHLFNNILYRIEGTTYRKDTSFDLMLPRKIYVDETNEEVTDSDLCFRIMTSLTIAMNPGLDKIIPGIAKLPMSPATDDENKECARMHSLVSSNKSKIMEYTSKFSHIIIVI